MVSLNRRPLVTWTSYDVSLHTNNSFRAINIYNGLEVLMGVCLANLLLYFALKSSHLMFRVHISDTLRSFVEWFRAIDFEYTLLSALCVRIKLGTLETFTWVWGSYPASLRNVVGFTQLYTHAWNNVRLDTLPLKALWKARMMYNYKYNQMSLGNLSL